MNNNSIKYSLPEGRMDKIIRTIRREGAYICKGEDGSDIYNFHACTVSINTKEKKITFGAKLPVTRKHSKLQLEELAEVNIEEITENGN